MALKLVMLPPQTDTYRYWGRRLASLLPELDIVVAETDAEAAAAIVDADAAIGSLPLAVLGPAETATLAAIALRSAAGRVLLP